MNPPHAESTASNLEPIPGCDRWLKEFMQTRLPILSRTRERLHQLRKNRRDTIPRLCEEIIKDTGFTLNLIEQTNRVLKNRSKEPTRNLNHAALLLGVPYIHTLIDELPCLEEHTNESVKFSLLQHYQKNYHAALQACSWLGNKPSIHQDEIFLCAMLQGAETVNLWIAAPELAQQLDGLSADDRDAQTRILGCTLNELACSYAKHAHFPELYINSIEQASDPASQSLRLARLIARQADIDWYTDRMSELAEKVTEISGCTGEECISQIHRTAVQAARAFSLPGLKPAAARLLEYSLPRPVTEIVTAPQPAAVKTTPPENTEAQLIQTEPEALKKPLSHREIYRNSVLKLKATEKGQPLSAHEVISTGMEALHKGLRLQRVSFLMLNRERDVLQSKYLEYEENVPSLEQITLELKGNHLFTRLMKASQCLWLHDSNRQKYWSLIPAGFREHTSAHTFLAMSVFVNDKAVGMFYADNHGSNISITEKHQQYFKQICILVGQALMQKK